MIDLIRWAAASVNVMTFGRSLDVILFTSVPYTEYVPFRGVFARGRLRRGRDPAIGACPALSGKL
jgi:hypothetical protein